MPARAYEGFPRMPPPAAVAAADAVWWAAAAAAAAPCAVVARRGIVFRAAHSLGFFPRMPADAAGAAATAGAVVGRRCIAVLRAARPVGFARMPLPERPFGGKRRRCALLCLEGKVLCHRSVLVAKAGLLELHRIFKPSQHIPTTFLRASYDCDSLTPWIFRQNTDKRILCRPVECSMMFHHRH